jgi:ectoine hydroxylase
MNLTARQLDDYAFHGFVFVPGLFSTEEIALIASHADKISTHYGPPYVIFESDEKTPRTIVNPQKIDPVFASLEAHPRIIEPAMQILRSTVCTFQLGVNHKAALQGGLWWWHQDWPTYAHDDGFPEPRMVNVIIFLDDVNEFNGPLMISPGSHNEEIALPQVSTQGTSFAARWLDDRAVLKEKLQMYGIAAPKGPAGSVCFQHTNLIHGSGPNMSPWRRSIITFTVNATSNRARTPDRPSTRPAHLVCDSYDAIEMLSDDCLLRNRL